MVQSQLIDPPNVLFQLSKEYVRIGRTIRCIADLAGDPNILAKGLQITDAAVPYLSKAVAGRQRSDVETMQIVRVLILNSLQNLQAIDTRCSNISSPYVSSTTPPGAMELASLGKALETIGTNLECLATKIDATMLQRYFVAT